MFAGVGLLVVRGLWTRSSRTSSSLVSSAAWSAKPGNFDRNAPTACALVAGQVEPDLAVRGRAAGT
jgi:hypothetical protein